MFNPNDPNLDGDFKTLLEVQRERQAEREKRKAKAADIIRTLGLPKVNGDARKDSTTSSEPQRSQEAIAIRTELLVTLENDDVTAFKASHSRLKMLYKSFLDPELRDQSNNKTLLHEAIDKNAQLILCYLLSQGDDEFIMAPFDVTVKDISSKKTSLHVLAETGEFETLKRVVDSVDDLNSRYGFLNKTVLTQVPGQRPRHLTGLHLAALHGHTAMVEYFVEQGMDVNTVNNKHDTPVLWAARGNHIETTRALIRLKADMAHQNDKGSSPLYWAVRYGFKDMVNLLLTEGGANVNQTRKLGLVHPLVLAAAYGYVDILNILVKHGGDVNTKITSGSTALQFAASQGDVDMVEVLIGHGAQIDDIDDNGDTALLIASREGQLDVVEVLTAYRANLQHRNKRGHTVWHHAIDSPNNDQLVRLVDIFSKQNGCEGNDLRFPRGKSPMHICAVQNDIEKLHCLLKLGANPNAEDVHGNTFYHLAAKEGQDSVLEEFIKEVDVNAMNDIKETPLHIAARAGHLKCVEILVKKCKLELRNLNGETALHIACKSPEASREVVSLIVDTVVKAANWSLVDATDHNGNTALHLAASKEREEIIDVLHHLNPKVLNEAGDSPLHVAADTGAPELLETFLRVFQDQGGKGLDIDQLDGEGQTLLFITVNRGDAERVEMLIKKGADLAIKNRQGNTAIHSLILESKSDPDNMPMYLEVWKCIIRNAVKWHCLRYDSHEPDEDSEDYSIQLKEAIYQLVTTITNDENLSALALASKIGNKVFLESFLWTPGVFLTRTFDSYKFDITDLTPATKVGRNNTTKPRKARKKISNGSKVAALGSDEGDEEVLLEESALDLIVRITPIEVADEMLNIVPFKQIVLDYWTGYQWMYGVLLLIHVLYMGFLSHYGKQFVMTTMYKHIKEPNTTLAKNYLGARPFPNVLFFIWPLALLFFEMYYVIVRIYKRCRGVDTGNMKFYDGTCSPSMIINGTFNLIMYYATHIVCLLFCTLLIVWLVFYRFEQRYQAHVLCAALIVGWLFTMAFTKGFETVHSFSIILKYIIIRDIFRFFVIYLIILFAFSFGAMVLMQLSPALSSEYDNAGDVMFLFFNMMIGMAEMFTDSFKSDYEQYGYSSVPIIIVYLLYIILSTVVMLNLLIARMTDSYQLVSVREGTTWRVNSVQLALQIEKSLPWLPKIFRAFGLKKDWMYHDEMTNRWKIIIPASELGSETVADRFDAAKAISQLESKFTTLNVNYQTMANAMHQCLDRTKELSEKLDDLAFTMGQGEMPSTTGQRSRRSEGLVSTAVNAFRAKRRRKSIRPMSSKSRMEAIRENY